MEHNLKKIKDSSLGYSTIDHIKPIKIIIHNDTTRPIDKKLLPKSNYEDEFEEEFKEEFEKKYNWLWNWLF